ncbi:MAG: GWxTD domain-containing protein, partial [Bacteroidetes bacterium]
KVAYAARYWTSKDPRLLTPYNERKLEHYARLTYADLLYGASELGLRGWNTERGQIIVRYGTPIGDVVIIPKSSSKISESFRAMAQDPDPDNQGEGSRILQITRDGYGFDMFEEANTYNIWTYEDKKFVFEDPFRNGEFRLYSPSASDISQGSLPWLNDYAIRARETFREEPESYTYKAPGRQIDVPFLVASFKNFSSDLTDVYVNYGIPVNDFDRSDDIIDITANAGMFVVSENRDMLVEQRRTIYGLRTAQVVQFEESNLWIDTEQLRVPPGMQEVSVEFETAGAATVAVQRRKVEILDFSGDDLALSDLLLAYRVDEVEFGTPTLSTDIVRNGLSIMPAPWSVFSTKQPIYLYFEVYNLDLDSNGSANYLVEAALGPKKQGNAIGNFLKGIFGGGEAGVAVSLPIQISSANDGQYLILDASNQEPGLYTIALKITDQATGKTLQREQDLFLE